MHLVNERQLNLGLLLMRLGIAATLLFHTVPRLLGGARTWIQVGKDLRFLQGDFPSQIVGLTLLTIQVLASLGMVTGGLFRVSTVSLAILYGLYFINFLSMGFKTLPLYAIALACVCCGLMVTGPGQYAVAVKIEKK